MELLWKLFAKIVALPPIANNLIKRAQRTPYFHLTGYMDRWWLFNPYGNSLGEDDASRHQPKYPGWPSIRVHHILREDLARDMHDHPWDARTIILKGWYDEERLEPVVRMESVPFGCGEGVVYTRDEVVTHMRMPGDTATINHEDYHNIKAVSKGGVWTLFFTWEYKGTWGFLVDGKKVPWREYEKAAA